MSNFPSYVDLASRLAQSSDQWAVREWDLICSMRVCMPAVVVSFDSVKQTIVAQIAVREKILQNLVPKLIDIPEIPDVPVLLVGGGGFTSCPPITAGDECLLFFADFCINSWWANGGTKNAPERPRRHSLSDGFALVGLRSQPRRIANYSTTKFQIRSDDGQTVVELGAGEVTVTADGGTTKVVVTPGGVAITATTVTVNGNLVVNGDISNTGHLDGKTFLTHQHTGVATGGGTTGPVL